MKQSSLFVILFLFAGVTVGGILYVRAEIARRDLLTRHQTLQTANQDLQIRVEASQLQAEQLRRQLAELDEALGTTKVRLTASENRNVEQSREAVRLQQELAERSAHVSHLEKKLHEMQTALTALEAVRVFPEKEAGYVATIGRLEKELTAAREELRHVSPGPLPVGGPTLTTSRGRTASVVSVGPADAFVVINYGASHGALPGQNMRIMRDVKIMAVVHISDVHPEHSVAHVLPDSLQGALHKGDLALITTTAP